MELRAYAADQVARLFEKFTAEIARTVKQCDPDAVHDLRVSIRRLNQGLRVFRSFYPRREMKPLRKQLKRIMRFAGATRDTDIAVEFCVKHGISKESDLSVRLAVQRNSAARDLLAALRQTRPGALPQPAQCETSSLPPEKLARDTLPILVNKYRAAAEDAASLAASTKDMHQFRIQGKRLRYSLELFRPIYGPGLEEKLNVLRKAQQFLGDVNDCESMRQLLLACGVDVPRRLLAAVDSRQKKRIREFRDFWKSTWADREFGRRWINYLAVYPGRVGYSRKARPAAARQTG